MDPAEKKLRVFVALNVPAAWKSACASLQQELQRSLYSPAFRWVKSEQVHLTLRFLGALLPEEAGQVSSILEKLAASAPPFSLAARGLGCFPNVRRARVLWAGIEGETAALAELQRQVVRSTAHLGAPPEERPFSPHLTLARVKEARPEDLRALPAALARAFSLESFEVHSIHLMRSHLSSSGTRYEILSEHPLRGTPAFP
jgi:2'-5' RNA ligase